MCAIITNESSPVFWIITIVLGLACLAAYWHFIGRKAYGLADRLFRNTDWMVEYRCVACDHVLDGAERCLRHGVCPYCGHDSQETYCATRKVIYRISDGVRIERTNRPCPECGLRLFCRNASSGLEFYCPHCHWEMDRGVQFAKQKEPDHDP